MLSGARERVEELAARAALRPPPAAVVGAAAALALAAVGWAFLRWSPAAGPEIVERTETPAASAMAVRGRVRASEPSSPAEVVVHVVGAVRNPGVYRLAKGARAEDAVRAAGGPLGGADLGGLNLARQVGDGEQLVVPAKGEARPPSAPGRAQPGKPGGKVDINRASAEELDALPGVGPSTAAKIVQEREANGPYRSVEDLMRVPGIGTKKLDALKDLVTAG